jgi:hypothetical protein
VLHEGPSLTEEEADLFVILLSEGTGTSQENEQETRYENVSDEGLGQNELDGSEPKLQTNNSLKVDEDNGADSPFGIESRRLEGEGPLS